MAAILDFSKGHNSVNFNAIFCLGKLLFHSGGSNEQNCMVIIQMWGGRVLIFLMVLIYPGTRDKIAVQCPGKSISDLRANANFRRRNGGRGCVYLARPSAYYPWTGLAKAQNFHPPFLRRSF